MPSTIFPCSHPGRKPPRPDLQKSELGKAALFSASLGALPLAIARGAGSGSQNSVGTGVLGGMVTATVFAIFLIPVFYVAVGRLFKVAVLC